MARVERRNPLAAVREELLSEALAISDGRQTGDLGRPQAVHLRGLMAAQEGRIDLAIAYLKYAVQLAPSDPEPYNDLGDQLLRRRRKNHGFGAHLRALTLAPADPERYVRLASSLCRQHLHREGVAAYEEALRLRPDDSESHGELSDALRALGQVEPALRHCLTTIQLTPDDPDAHRRLGHLRVELGQPHEALAAFRRALELDDDRSDLQTDVGETLLRIGQPEDARRAFETALMLNPGNVAAGRGFVFTTELLGRRDDLVGGWVTLGAALTAQGRHREAAVAYRQAISRKPDCLRALTSLARTHMARGEPFEAIRCLEAAILVAPDFRQPHVDLGTALHTVGERDRGWQELAWYHDTSSSAWRHFEQPLWDGSPLDSRTILLWADASVEDTIFCLRYARLAKELGGRVVVECDEAVREVANLAIGVDRVLAPGEQPLWFDVHAPLLYLPALVPTVRSLELALTAPYLSAPDHLKARFRPQLGRHPGMAVGIAWAPGTGELGVRPGLASLAAFAPLARINGVRFVSLQLGAHAHELLAPPPGLRVTQLLDDANSVTDVAATIANLDLVIGVDTSVVHLAGALGKPVWTLLPRATSWPWLHEGDQTAWYPTMRLFRQTRPGDWDGVITAVGRALRAHIHPTEIQSQIRSSESCRGSR